MITSEKLTLPKSKFILQYLNLEKFTLITNRLSYFFLYVSNVKAEG